MASSYMELESEAYPSLAPPSSSMLSDAPNSEAVERPPAAPETAETGNTVHHQDATGQQSPRISAQTESLLKRIEANTDHSTVKGTPEWEAARQQIMRGMATSSEFATSPSHDIKISKRGGSSTGMPAGVNTIPHTLTSERSQRRGRGGRPRGRGRGGSTRGTKRKRNSGSVGANESDSNSESSSEEFVAVSMTKSGRTVQKPSTFVPPLAPSPTATPNKRKRAYRRDPDSAVCRVCLRGTSPASNMIVFCDGCNTPYHRFCHHPPIDQSVIDEVDKEWYCKTCEKERIVPVPEVEVVGFVSAADASHEQKQRYFSGLAPGMLVTLLMRASSLHPDLPLFSPDFVSRPPNTSPLETVDAENTSAVAPRNSASINGQQTNVSNDQPADTASYVLNNEADEPVPEGHPPNYPRPGHGLMQSLPPESEDSSWLVEPDDRYGVFTHFYQVDSRAASAGLNGSVTS